MNKIAAILPVLLLLSQCRTLDMDSAPGTEREFEALSIRFQVRGPETRVSGKINCRIAGPEGVFYFFTPLNQVVARMYTENEQVLLVPENKNGCWRGSFNELIRHYWSLELTLGEWLDLLKNGNEAAGVPDAVQCTVKARDTKGRPQRLMLENGRITLTLSVTRRESRRGRFPRPSGKNKRCTIPLEDVFADG